jgi:1-deoxy-D-xylulose-5-phosphate reductoisomerase
MAKRIAILGSTGSVGRNALRLIADRPDHFAAVALTAHTSAAELAAQVDAMRPAAACLAGSSPPPAGARTAWFRGDEGILEALEHARPDLVLNAITGAAGLAASEWTVRRGLPLALANKESLVLAGSYLVPLARETGAAILPVDSEHCAVHQCLRGERLDRVRRIWLTASGGPFRQRALDTFAAITPEEALRHPTWDMGPRITVGSATMMNKAFEVVEAHWLFGLEPEQISVLIHPQSIVHSMVEFVDGSMTAQLGIPDMRVPILYCLAHPDRIPFDFAPFDASRWRTLEFALPDASRYPAVGLAYETLARGGDSGAVLNAADEVMTELFLTGRTDFPSITRIVAQVVRELPAREIHTLDDVRRADRSARAAAADAAKVKA